MEVMCTICGALRFQVLSKWVKAHQDSKIPTHELSMEARLNILADTVAKYNHQYGTPLPQRPLYKDEELYSTQNGVHIKVNSDTIWGIVHVPDYKDYICQK